MESLFTDLRHALRNLARRPGFTTVSVLVLALGLGATVTMYSALDAVVLQPLPFEQPDRLVWIWNITPQGRTNSLSAEDYFDYRDQTTTLESLAARNVFLQGRIVTGGSEPERVTTITVSENLFTTFGIAPLLGRSFTDDEAVVGAPAVVILSHGFWQRRHGGDLGVVGQSIMIEGAPCQVVGVMPEGFDFPGGIDLWFPMQRGGPAETGRGNNNFLFLGRLADGVGLNQADAELKAMAARLVETYPDIKKGWGVQVVPLTNVLVGPVQGPLYMLLGAVLLLLLIACANISSLFLARVTARQGEFAVRLSLGAPRRTLVRQLLTESLLLTLSGALLGTGVSLLSIQVLRTSQAVQLPRLQNMGLDTGVLLFTLVITLVTALLVGVLPALRSTDASLLGLMIGSGRTTKGDRSQRLRSGMVVAQVALSMTLLVGSGLLVRSLVNLRTVDTGMQPEQVLTFRFQAPEFRYQSPEAAEGFLDALVTGLRRLPGVQHAAAVDRLPLYGGPYNGIYRSDKPPADPTEFTPALRRIASEGYFESLGTRLLAGRDFLPTDRLNSSPVTIISRYLAEELFPGEEALGRVIVLPWGTGIPLEIVGIADNLPDYGLMTSLRRGTFYLAARQYPGTDLNVVVRAGGDPTALFPAVRSFLQGLEPDGPITAVQTMSDRIVASTGQTRFQAFLVGLFAFLALVLAGLGLYGVLAYIVAQRTRELGIRVALGAGPGRVIGQVLRQGLTLAGLGVIIGLLGGFFISLVIRTMLFQVAPTDPVTYLTVCGVLMLVTLAASVVPSLRALAIDPIKALRSE